MASNSTDRVVLALFGMLGSNAMALAEPPPAPSPSVEEEVPLYSAEDAWRLAHAPESRMVDATTCERVEGVWRMDAQGNRQVVANSQVALFRKQNRRQPFMRVETRSDGVFVARFPAQPNEVIYAKTYRLDPQTKRYVYSLGPPLETVCRAGKVSTGELEQVPDEQSGDVIPGER